MSGQTWVRARYAGVCDRCDTPFSAGTAVLDEGVGRLRAACCRGRRRRVSRPPVGETVAQAIARVA